MRSIDLIVIHSSGTPNGEPLALAEIDRRHAILGFRRDPAAIGANQPSLKHIVYHYVVYSVGVVVTARGLEEAGVHASGRSLDICLVGTDAYRLEQWLALRALVCATLGRLARRAEVPGAPHFTPTPSEALAFAQRLRVRICGANELAETPSPGFSVAAWLAGGMEELRAHILETSEGAA